MFQPGFDLNFTQETLRAYGRRQFGMQHLDGDLALVPEIRGEIDGGHTAGAELALDAVTLGGGGA